MELSQAATVLALLTICSLNHYHKEKLIDEKKDFLEHYTFCQNRVESELRSIIGNKSLALYDMLRYHLGWQDMTGNPGKSSHGKLIRPMLCLLCFQATGGGLFEALPAAASLELIHNFSLIHDDIQDNSHSRRQRATVWKIWGQPQAINAGDAMFTIAYLALLRLHDNNINDAKIVRCIQLLSEVCLNLCEGQYMDMAFEDSSSVSIDNYLNMIMKKTAGLIATSTALGACLGTENEEVVTRFYNFGRDLGMAFQIADDILGIWGIEEKIGKPVISDILQKKKTLPVVYSINNTTGKDRQELKRFYSQKHTEKQDVAGIVEIINRVGARAYSQQLERQYYEQALSNLDTIDIETAGRTALVHMVRFLMERDY
jgi:geranylgeranyl diphosphate synthase type I